MQKTLPFSIERAFICCFVGVIFISFTEQKLETEKHQEEWFRINLTDFVDHLMPFVSKYIVENEMDPLMIPDVGQSFWIVGPLLILPSLHAELTYSFSSGSMHYLSKLERNGTVTVSYTGQTFTIDGNVVFDRILALMKMIEKRITELFIAHFDQMNETVCPWNIFELHRYWSKYQSSEFEMN
ncbi:uncharacterized protein LOC114874522 isoform X5 [Osmia bicornis bicornis]|uniref:uncharacterized protein LOC114874522 isoform X5 n=1 Tax=Osmia bicornis bicornis TaxID=1437191 RepID=UPI001EAF85DA|nr:uncharacterized protein LOC114874522 isoform X5 [Osmia bicornis bicornis]